MPFYLFNIDVSYLKNIFARKQYKSMLNLQITVFFVFLSPFLSAFSDFADPEGFQALVESIKSTKFTEVSSLRGKRFEIRVPEAKLGDELQISPVEAFATEQVDKTTFRVTILEPDVLVVDRGFSQEYKIIGWKLILKGVGLIPVGAGGQATCRYELTFKQTGGNNIDLAKVGPEYNLSWDLSNETGIGAVTREGSVLVVIRTGNSSNDARIRLRIEEKSGPYELLSDWVAIPSCQVSRGTPEPEPRPIPNPIPIPDPEPNPDSCFQKVFIDSSICDVACQGTVWKAGYRIQNVCKRRVRCNNIVWTVTDINANRILGVRGEYWVDLNAGSTTTAWYEMNLPYKPSKWGFDWNLSDCFYR